jgi:hypothetical protein
MKYDANHKPVLFDALPLNTANNKNALALDVNNKRPTRYVPGDHHFNFGIDFTAAQTVTWKLGATNSPLTTVTATKSSKAWTSRLRRPALTSHCSWDLRRLSLSNFR